MSRWLIACVPVALLTIGGAAIALQNESAAPVSTTAPAQSPRVKPKVSASPKASGPVEDAPASRGETPMPERVAVLGLLNKRNGISRDLTMKPGQALRAGDVIVRLRACERTAPWEVQKLTGAFVQVDVRGPDDKWRRAFSGWLYKESPSLNVVEHAIYDVWPKSCTMTHPDIGPGTLRASAPSSGGNTPARRSSARKSGAGEPAAPAAAPAPADIATPNNPT